MTINANTAEDECTCIVEGLMRHNCNDAEDGVVHGYFGVTSQEEINEIFERLVAGGACKCDFCKLTNTAEDGYVGEYMYGDMVMVDRAFYELAKQELSKLTAEDVDYYEDALKNQEHTAEEKLNDSKD